MILLNSACVYLESQGIVDVRPTSLEICWPKDSTVLDSAHRLIPGLILGLITNLVSVPRLVSYVYGVYGCVYVY